MKQLLVCLCCGFQQELTEEEAYDAGWDTPARFSIPGPTCPLCPSSPYFTEGGVTGMRERHAAAHVRWETEGRPEKFELLEEMKLLFGSETLARAKR